MRSIVSYPDPRGCSRVTPEELEELRRIPGNESVRVPSRPAPAGKADPAMRPSPVRPVRVCYRLAPVAGIPMLAGATLAVFVDTRDPEMADGVAEALMHRLGLTGEVVS